MRTSKVERKTKETDILVKLNIDGSGGSIISTGTGFMDHMLTLFAKHSGIDLEVKCDGDMHVDFHHSVEDIGICLGMALDKALGDKKGIKRYADAVIPMDEALILCAADISGRGGLYFDVDFPTEKIGSFDCELVKEFFAAFVRSADITLHIRKICGDNSHHIAEACFKAFARVIRYAVEADERTAGEVPSTKGVL